MSSFQAEASKEKKALEEEFDAGFDVIFNYGYGCCAFVHNICGKPRILEGMPDMSKPLPQEFFINPRCTPDAILIEAVVAQEAAITGGVEHSSTVGAKVGDDFDSLSKVVGEREEPGVSSGS